MYVRIIASQSRVFLGHSVETSGALTIQQHIQMQMEKEHVAACAELTLLQMKLISFETSIIVFYRTRVYPML